ncbi:MAG: DUF167 domain-containing protein [Verrucomicrobiales bacterium]|jgi:uncharacterized protein (TIGR00251 family)|nr:DUF167 domain-containing protein [Verrucomicrobiales bacterium]
MPTVSENRTGVTVSVHLTPRSSRDKILKIHDGALKIAIQAPPVDNAANDELIKFLAKTLDLSKRDVVIVSGRSSKRKTVAISGITKEKILQTLATLNVRA